MIDAERQQRTESRMVSAPKSSGEMVPAAIRTIILCEGSTARIDTTTTDPAKEVAVLELMSSWSDQHHREADPYVLDCTTRWT